MRRFDAVIFDLDGVLVDTAEFHYLAWKRLADERGLSFDRRKNERLKGVSRLESLKILLGDSSGACDDLDGLAARKNGYYVEMIQRITPSDVLPGVEKLLKSLHAQGLKIGVASASRNAKTVIGKLRIAPLLDAVTDGNDCQKSKPFPDLFLHCAEQLGVAPERCVVVEDAQAGIDAATAAGMRAVGVGSAENLTGAYALIATIADFTLELLT